MSVDGALVVVCCSSSNRFVLIGLRLDLLGPAGDADGSVRRAAVSFATSLGIPPSHVVLASAKTGAGMLDAVKALTMMFVQEQRC